MKLNQQKRKKIWKKTIASIENYFSNVSRSPIIQQTNPESIRSLLTQIDFTSPMDPDQAIEFVVKGFWNHQVQVSNPRYFGLFNPCPTTMGIAADTLVAAFNPQLASWNHSPFAVEIEQHLIHCFAKLFGYPSAKIAGTFTNGGAEANHTALLTALVKKFPKFASLGLQGVKNCPALYVSTQTHHSVLKASRLSGLGSKAVRQVAVDKNLKMDTRALVKQITRDKKNGFVPFFVVATVGTTNAGVIDPVEEIYDIAKQFNLWCHVDAAWGGAAILIKEYEHLFKGIDGADSITLDAHKWLSVPMGAGLYLTRHKEIMLETFNIKTTYMPPDSTEINAIDPYKHTMQWSRRFIGLKLFLSLAVAGWEGYRREIKRQIYLGSLLRKELRSSKWEIINNTPLPLVCFTDQLHPQGKSLKFLESIQQKIVLSGKAWVSIAFLRKDVPVIRACINNITTKSDDIHFLVNALNDARNELWGTVV